MEFHYYPETDSLYVELSPNSSVESVEVTPGVVLDFDEQKTLVGIDIDHATKVANLSGMDRVLWAPPEDVAPEERKQIESALAEVAAGHTTPWSE